MSISQGLVMEENEDPGFEIVHLSFRKKLSESMYGGPVNYYIGNIVFRLTDPDAINRMKYYLEENEELRVAPDLELMEKYYEDLHFKFEDIDEYGTNIEYEGVDCEYMTEGEPWFFDVDGSYDQPSDEWIKSTQRDVKLKALLNGG